MKVKITSGSLSDLKANVCLVPVYSDETEIVALVDSLKQEFPSAAHQIDTEAPKGTSGETTLLRVAEGKTPRIVLVGLGEKSKVKAEAVRRAMSAAARAARGRDITSMAVYAFSTDEAEAAFEGVYLGLYEHITFKGKTLEETRKKQAEVEALTVALPDKETAAATKPRIEELENVCRAVYITRELANAPNGDMYPEKLAEVAEKEGKKADIKVKIWDKKKIADEKMVGLLGVNAGSSRPPVCIIMEYKGGEKNDAPLVLVGKGITFDTGGVSMKPSAGMAAMKLDMHGSATVIGAILAIAKNKLPINVVVIVPATENMVSGTAMLPGDILRYPNGVTVEVDNTDAEGRLVLADGLLQAAKLSPKAVIDVATLTGACVVALGSHATGMMGYDSELKAKLSNAAAATGENVCELPLYDDYKESMKSDIADLKNAGGREAGAITAAIFLSNFIDKEIPWVHLDIAGTGMLSKPGPYSPLGGSGVGVRLLYSLAKNF